MIGIYVNHTSKFKRNTGIQRCLRSTGRSLNQLGESIAPLVWEKETNDFALASKADLRNLSHWNGPPIESWDLQFPPSSSWLLIFELISGPYQPTQEKLFELSKKYGWSIAGIFHDAIPLKWSGISAEYHSIYMKGLVNYDLVLPISKNVRKELENFWTSKGLVFKDHIAHLPLPAEVSGFPRQMPDLNQIKNCFDGKLNILCVSSLEKRKNHLALFKALAWLSAQGKCNYHLQLVGWANDPSVLESVQRSKSLGLDIDWDVNADDEALFKYYQFCHFTFYPSLEEGYGLPVLESLWLGRPCFANLNLPVVMDDNHQGGYMTFNTNDWHLIAIALSALQEDTKILLELQKELLDRKLNTWNDYSRSILTYIKKKDL